MAAAHRHRKLIDVAASVTRRADPQRTWLKGLLEDEGDEDAWMDDARSLCPPDPEPPEPPEVREQRVAQGMAAALQRVLTVGLRGGVLREKWDPCSAPTTATSSVAPASSGAPASRRKP